MKSKTALTVIPSVLMFVGLVFAFFPDLINDKLFVDLDGRANDIARLLRRMIGASVIGMAIILLSCRELRGADAKKVLYGL